MKEVIFSYLKKNRKYSFLFFWFFLLFLIVFILYSQPVYVIWYAFFLCFCFGMIFIGIDFYFYWKKHIHLQLLKNKITIHLDELPITTEIIEKDYQVLLEILLKNSILRESELNTSRAELLDYYTLWAHQIKTPISAMRLFFQSEKNTSSEMKIELFKIEKYVDMALQFLRLESLTSDLLFKSYSLDEIVKQAIKNYSLFFIQKKLSLQLEELNCTIITDQKWLLFVLEQLLSNALKYTARGKIKIYMDPDKEKTLIIEDTGIGIHSEDLPRIFERGFTGYNGRTYQKSTGIGLYLCKKICSRLSHEISITSVVGKGTLVSLNLAKEQIWIE